MDIREVLEYIDKIFPSCDENSRITNDEWEKNIHKVMPAFQSQMTKYDCLLSTIFKGIPRYSTSNCLYWKEPRCTIGRYVIKPKKDFDICVEVHINRSRFTKGFYLPSHSIIFFAIDGDNEVKAFKALYCNYRRIIELLFRKADISFGGCYSEDRNMRTKLDKLIENEASYAGTNSDYRSTLEFYTNFNQNQCEMIFVRKLQVILALYDSTYNYLRRDKKPDKILDYYWSLIEKEESE